MYNEQLKTSGRDELPPVEVLEKNLSIAEKKSISFRYDGGEFDWESYYEVLDKKEGLHIPIEDIVDELEALIIFSGGTTPMAAAKALVKPSSLEASWKIHRRVIETAEDWTFLDKKRVEVYWTGGWE